MENGGGEWIEATVIREANQFVIDLSRARLARTNWDGADLRNAVLVGTDLRYARLNNVNFEGARLPSANLEDANLTAANFTQAIVVKAKLSGAMLAHADFDGANLGGADLDGALLTGEAIYTKETIASDTTTWPDGYVPPPVTVRKIVGRIRRSN